MKNIFLKYIGISSVLIILFSSCFKDDLLKEIDALKDTVSSMQRRNDSLSFFINAKADSLGKALTAAQKRSDSLASVLKTKSDSLSIALGITNSNLATLTRSVDSIKSQITSISLKLNEMNTQLTMVNDQLIQLNQEFSNTLADITSISNEYQILSNSMVQINQQITILQAEQLKLLEQLNLIIQQLNTPKTLPPTIVLQKINFISGNSAIVQGDLTNDGGTPIIEKGFCWSLNPNPTIFDKRTSDGATKGVHKSMLNNLSPSSLYYVRAYAKNASGISYSEQLNFRTLNELQISDVEGNIYNTVQIGVQLWMKENLKTTSFNDGSQIPLWTTYFETGYNYYANNPTNGSKYGLIYKYYTMADPKGVCPIGWHVPTEAEWKVMINYLGGPNLAGDKMKESGQANWVAPTSAATNESGFTALPGGAKDCSMSFVNLGTIATFWSSDKVVGGSVKGINLSSQSSTVTFGFGFDCNASYIRCIKD